MPLDNLPVQGNARSTQYTASLEPAKVDGALAYHEWSAFDMFPSFCMPRRGFGSVVPKRLLRALVLLLSLSPLSAAVLIQDVNLATLASPLGSQILGAAANDLSGRFISAAGDVNADGYDDIIVASVLADPFGRTDAGICYVLFGSLAGLPSVIDLASFVTSASAGFRILGPVEHHEVGVSVSGLGDVNGDGVDDIILGSYTTDWSGVGYVIFGRNVTDGSSGASTFADIDLLAFVSDPSIGFRIMGAAPDDYSSNFVGKAGDVNADGIDDIVVGAPRSDPGGRSRAGTTYVIFGRDVAGGATAFVDINLSTFVSGPLGFLVLGANAGDFSGNPVRTVGDVNADGIDDLIIGAPSYDTGRGASYVIFGRDVANGVTAFGDIELSSVTTGSTVGFRVIGAAAAGVLHYINTAGDINNDGVEDIVLGSYSIDLTNPDRRNVGIAYVIFGRNIASGAPAFGDIELSNMVTSASTGFRMIGAAANDNAGYSVSSAGDINDDGIADIAVGAFGSQSDAGTSYVIYGRDVPGGSPAFADIELSSFVSGSTVGFRILGAAAGDRSGTVVSTAGDVNRDGVSDIIVGAYYADPINPTRVDAGISYVIYGTPSAPSVAPSASPSVRSTVSPSAVPTLSPTEVPSASPSFSPSITPSLSPSIAPSTLPSLAPSCLPSAAPSDMPSITPSLSPSVAPSTLPSVVPSALPTVSPSNLPTISPSETPSTSPSMTPTEAPQCAPSATPTRVPSTAPTRAPVIYPTRLPTNLGATSPPTQLPTEQTSPVATFSTTISLSGLATNQEFDLVSQDAVAEAVCKSMSIPSNACVYVPPTQFTAQARRLLRGTGHPRTLAVSYNSKCKIALSMFMKDYPQYGGDASALHVALINVFESSDFAEILYQAAAQSGATTVLSATYGGKEFSAVETVEPQGSDSSASSSAFSMGAIIGIAAGGAALLLGIACAVYYYKCYDGLNKSGDTTVFTAVPPVDNFQMTNPNASNNPPGSSGGCLLADSDDEGSDDPASFGANSSRAAAPSASPVAEPLQQSWLGARLLGRGFDSQLINKCEKYLVVKEGFVSEEVMGSFPQREFTASYLSGLDLTDSELQKYLFQLHSEMHFNYASNIPGKFHV